MQQLSSALIIVGAVMALLPELSGGQENTTTLTASGFVSLQEGQIVTGSAYYAKPQAKTDHVWVQQMFTGLYVQAKFNPYRIVGNVGLEMKICNEYPRYLPDFGKSRRLYYYPYLHRADFVYSAGNVEKPWLNISAGYFPFKYNDDAKNLGEYLFRTGTYPQYIITEFDFPLARLLGLHASGTLFDNFKWDALATTNIEWTALGDVNLAAIASYKPIPLAEIGCGVYAASVVSVDTHYTTPKTQATAYKFKGKEYFYSFRGQKLMARAALDPQSLFKNDIFGPQDFRIYGEAALLGIWNYPVSEDTLTQYTDRLKRLPIMFGFNFPAFRVLDVLSIEFEWFGSRYPNDLSPLVFDNQPVPLSSMHNLHTSDYNPDNYAHDDWKWSVYGKKTIAGRFFIVAQVARDHMRWWKMEFNEQDWQEALRSPKNLYWTFKTGYNF
jgi:hypothetical protein